MAERDYMYATVQRIEPDAEERLIDLRSDTVTRPGDGMRKAMASAVVGDDVYGDDPTVNALEEKAAEMLGKESALYVSSGTQSNLTALLTHCGRGDEYFAGKGYHIPTYEAGGAAVLGGIAPCILPVNEKGGLTAEAVEAAIKPDDTHFPVSNLVCLENTWNGRVQEQAEIERIAKVARANGMSIHLDGARLMNAVVASNSTAADLAAPFDSVSLCLSKGLGAPVGSVLCGPADFIKRARRNRKILGGGMRQAGVLAACGLYALKNNVARLSEDHARARLLAESLDAIEGLSVQMEKVETNMIFADMAEKHHKPFAAHMRAAGIILGGMKPSLRIVVHLDVKDNDIERVADAARAYFS